MCSLRMAIKYRDTMSNLRHPQMQRVASREEALKAPCGALVLVLDIMAGH